MNMKIKMPGLEFDKPVYNGSGSFEYGEYQWTAFAKAMDFQGLPAVTLKTSTIKSKITPEKRSNLMYSKGSQIMNSIGLQNPPIEGVVKKIAEYNEIIEQPLIASASGDTIDEFAENVKILSEQDVVAVEINLSCPNVDKGGITFGTDVEVVEEVVRRCKAVSKKPIYVKLTPNVTNIADIAIAAEKGGADAIIAINTLLGFMVDPKTGKPVVARGYGGYSGPGIFPVAARAVHQIFKVVNIPIVGVGGIMKGQDVIDMMSAGASVCQVVTGSHNDVEFFTKINKEVEEILEELGVKDINEIIGRSHKFKPTQVLPQGQNSH
ncbi:dihydroorotate dehydrogenase [Mycoplasma todarodis]|uniref:dihydroorotate dehydrogenase n=1 Tax=Mycoplasma todarodis TaxID=1937191 RepID=UPI003B2D49FB